MSILGVVRLLVTMLVVSGVAVLVAVHYLISGDPSVNSELDRER